MLETIYLFISLIGLVGGIILQITSFNHIKDDKLPTTKPYWLLKDNYKNSKGYRMMAVGQYMFFGGLLLSILEYWI